MGFDVSDRDYEAGWHNIVIDAMVMMGFMKSEEGEYLARDGHVHGERVESTMIDGDMMVSGVERWC